MESRRRVSYVLMTLWCFGGTLALRRFPNDRTSDTHSIEELFQVRFGRKGGLETHPSTQWPSSSPGQRTSSKFRNDRENELIPHTHKELDKPPGSFFDPRPFEPLSSQHYNPTVFNFPSFTTVVDSPNSSPRSQTNNLPSNPQLSQDTFNNIDSNDIGPPQQHVVGQADAQIFFNPKHTQFTNSPSSTQVEDQAFQKNPRFSTDFFTQSFPVNDDPFESLSNLVNGLESSQPSFASLLTSPPQSERNAQDFPPPPIFIPDPNDSTTDPPTFPFDLFQDPSNPSEPPIFPPSASPPFPSLPPLPPSPFPGRPPSAPSPSPFPSRPPSAPGNPFLTLGPFTSPAPPSNPFDPNFGSGNSFGLGDGSPLPFDPTFPGPPAPKRFQPEVGGSCIAFTGERGLCLGMENCPALRPLVKQLHNKELLVVLLNNVCRFENGQVYFCCEYPAFQPGELQLADKRQPAFVRSPHGAPLPLPGECGTKARRAKIIGGEDSEENEWPWLVAVGRPDTNKLFVVDCGGSLITTRHVITAASCFLFPEFFQPTHARVGEHDVSSLDSRHHEDFVIVGRNEPGFLSPTTQNNLMIVTLGGDVTFTDFVRPICLPPPDSSMPSLRSSVILAGWGLSRAPDDFDVNSEKPVGPPTPKHIKQAVTSIQDCQEAYSDPTSNFRVIDHRNICIRRPGIDGICVGDTGGPIVQLQSADSYALVGVISTSAGCLDQRLPTLGTKIEPYLEWVHYVIQGPQEGEARRRG